MPAVWTIVLETPRTLGMVKLPVPRGLTFDGHCLGFRLQAFGQAQLAELSFYDTSYKVYENMRSIYNDLYIYIFRKSKCSRDSLKSREPVVIAARLYAMAIRWSFAWERCQQRAAWRKTDGSGLNVNPRALHFLDLFGAPNDTKSQHIHAYPPPYQTTSSPGSFEGSHSSLLYTHTVGLSEGLTDVDQKPGPWVAFVQSL